MSEEIFKYAVALSYDFNKDLPPSILAKGSGFLADRILEFAKEKDIPIYYSKELVSLLYNLDIGDDIPEDMYMAVAEVIVYLMKLQEKVEGN